MLIEEQRFLHEDLERLEQAISDRALDEPRNIRDRLNRDHQVANFLDRIQEQSQRLLSLYKDPDGARAKELQSLSTGDPFEEFYKQLGEIRDFHRRYPNEPVENPERAYKKRGLAEGDVATNEVDNLFTGEESFGRFFDLTNFHEQYLNLPGIRGGKRLTYLQYLDIFDVFIYPQMPIKRSDRMRDEYSTYVGGLASYFESFLKRTRPLNNPDKFLLEINTEFEQKWTSNQIPGWSLEKTNGSSADNADSQWCSECEKEFKNENVYKSHLTGKKHLKAVEAKRKQGNNGERNNDSDPSSSKPRASETHRLKEQSIAEREFRIEKLTSFMQAQRTDTKVNVERRQGMTERERQQELEALFAESNEPLGQVMEDESDGEGDDKIYNPLKLPLAWDGKPIPFWLYKLHGLGVEFTCEVCGNFVYMGRRAFDKHFNEARHIYGLKCLGITNTTLFREITSIDEAQKLWAKLQQDKKKEKASTENVVQMEDSEGNVMPEKVYYDLQKQGLV